MGKIYKPELLSIKGLAFDVKATPYFSRTLDRRTVRLRTEDSDCGQAGWCPRCPIPAMTFEINDLPKFLFGF